MERLILEKIQGILSGVEWDADTANDIAAVLEEAGYAIKPPSNLIVQAFEVEVKPL